MKADFSDVTKTVAFTQPFAVKAGEIRVTRGRDAGRIVRIDSPTFSIGSGPSVHLRLSDVGVSREHVRLATLPDGLSIHDAGSKNGTWIGGMRIDRVVVSSSVVIAIGDASLELAIDPTPTTFTISRDTRFGDALGVSPAMRSVFAYLGKAAGSDVTVLLEGESGVGKEVLAVAVHRLSARADGPFVTVDCGAIPRNLVESELFGHERGAFTGADRAKTGLFRQAEGGTLFLDEVGELPIDVQPKLLRAIEQREVRSLGSNVPWPIDVRIIAATNRNLKEQVALGTFREDLFYRLAVARVRVPALRERAEDIVPLATRFLREITKDGARELPPAVASMLRTHVWPGNVRELKNAVRRFALLDARQEDELFDGLTSSTLRSSASSGAREALEMLAELPLHEARQQMIDRLEAAYVPAVLQKVGGNVSKAAEHAKIARSSFYRMLERVRADGAPADGDEG